MNLSRALLFAGLVAPIAARGSSLRGDEQNHRELPPKWTDVDDPSFTDNNCDPEPKDKVYQFNMLGYPEGKEFDGNCGNGGRIFVKSGSQTTVWVQVEDMNKFKIEDCDGTDGRAILQTPIINVERDADTITNANFKVFIRLKGPNKAGNTLDICSNCADKVTGEKKDCDTALRDDECEVGEINLERSDKGKFTIANKLWAQGNEDVLWDVTAGTDFKNAEFRFYKC